MNQIAEIGPDEREFAPPDADDFRADSGRPKGAFDLVGLRDAVKPRERGPDLIDGWLRVGAMSMIAAPSGIGKSFLALDLAHAVAAGTSWHNCETRPGTVVYVAAEDAGGIRDRLCALKRDRPDAAQMAEDLRAFYLIERAVSFTDETEVGGLVEALGEVGPNLVIIDTLARCLADADENSSRDMGKVVASLDRIRRETGAHVMLVHHTGKDATRGARGSSALRAAVDTEIGVGSDHGVISAFATKMRNGALPAPLHFSLSPIGGSAVLTPMDRPDKAQRIDKHNIERARAADNRARDLLDHLPTGAFSAASAKAAIARAGVITGTPAAIRKAAARTFDRMVDMGLVAEVENGFRVTEQGRDKK